jgi:transcriptional regulator with XRE-family HTH domain
MPRQSRTSYSPQAREAARLLGARVAVARRERRWTLSELAERVGVSRITMAKVVRGDLNVRLGVAFEAAAVLGIPLFDEDSGRRRIEAARLDDRLAVLPRLVRHSGSVDNDF